MIVKNEAAIITRLLESVIGFIDTFCICDTGSTDNTIEIAEDFFRKHSIVGKIIREPFRNFEYNRTFSLKQCWGMSDADYMLLLDADMVFVPGSQIIDMHAWKNGLKADAYSIFQGSSSFYYKNIRLLKNTGKFVYRGVTHEYIHCNDDYTSETIDRATLFIRDIGDGGSKSDKFQRDILLLTTALKTEPRNNKARYTFYLANSYRDIGDFENAIKTYKKRIDLGGWIEEVWYSYYSLGRCYYNNKNYARAIYYWLEGYSCLPDRVENLHEIIQHYRKEEKYTLAYHFYLLATKAKDCTNMDHLFIHKDIYDYKVDYEHSVIGYYVSSPIRDILNSCMKVLCCPDSDASTVHSVLSNYKFYVPAICEKCLSDGWDVLQNIDFRREGFVSSSPTLAMLGDQLWVNVRFVNYAIGEDGEYLTQKTIESINVIAIFQWKNPDPHRLFENVVKNREFLLKYDTSSDGKYVGLEDVRFFVCGDRVLYHANRIVDEKVFIEHGIIDIEAESTRGSVFLHIENQQKIEKNWVLFENPTDGSLKMVYNWYPLTIGTKDLLGEYIYDLVTNPTPNLFKHVRGSTHGIRIKDEIWFLCHLVSFENRRYYYHIMVVLDTGSLKIKKYTHPFTFEKSPVEYALGIVYNENAGVFLISYSAMDRTSRVCVIPKPVFHDMFYMV